MTMTAVPWHSLPRAQLASKLAGVLSFSLAQAAVQAIGFGVGLLLVRLLSIQDYAYYALAVSMVGLANVMLDLGLGNALLACGGPLRQWPRRSGSVQPASSRASARTPSSSKRRCS